MNANQSPRHRRRFTSSLRLPGSVLLTCALGFGVVACGTAPQKPPATPLKQAKQDDRIQEEERIDMERRNLAPPPAYGNKVVMAEGTATTKF